jgi:DNA-binding NarL/FixJ family response regulator
MSGTDTPPVRVFLVEDSPIVRLRLAEALTTPGTIEVVGEADSEAEAVAALRSTPWNALILDLTLKQGSGLGVLKAIRPWRPPGAKIIVLTNYAATPMRQASLAQGADLVLDKMHESHQVREVLDAMARQVRAPRAADDPAS